MTNDKDRDLQNGKMSEIFKAGWDQAGREGAVSPELAKAWVDDLGIHPDRVQQFADAQWQHVAGKGDKPDPKDFGTPVVAPIRGKDKGGPSGP